MKRLMIGCAALACLGFAVASVADLNAADKKVLTIEEIMKKAHTKGGALPAIRGALKSDKVNWDAVESKTKDLLLLAGDLSKNKPEKGEQASWERLTKAYLTNVELLEKAVKSQDLKEARAAEKAISGSCGACHKVHKG